MATAQAPFHEDIPLRRADPQLAHRTDALAMLVRSVDRTGQPMADDELVDQLVTLLLAGHDSTSTPCCREFCAGSSLAPTTAPGELVKPRHVTMVPRQGAMVTVRRHLPTAERVPTT